MALVSIRSEEGEEAMPLDATTYNVPDRDTLADIDKTKPLTVESVRRIVRAIRAAGLLAMDHVEELRGRFYRYPERMPYFTPHSAVDAFLGADARSSCPCNLKGDARRFLVELGDLHRHILFYRASAPAQTDLIEDGLIAFEAMLLDTWDFGM
jgi:hypothetical protein